MKEKKEEAEEVEIKYLVHVGKDVTVEFPDEDSRKNYIRKEAQYTHDESMTMFRAVYKEEREQALDALHERRLRYYNNVHLPSNDKAVSTRA